MSVKPRRHRQAEGRDQLSGLIAGDCRPHQFLPIEEDFDETGALDGCAGGDVGAEIRPVNLHNDAPSPRILLRQTDSGNLRVGVDDGWDGFFPERDALVVVKIAGKDFPLIHGPMGKHHAAGNVSDGEDPGDSGHLSFVNDNPPTIITDPQRIELLRMQMGLPSRADQRIIRRQIPDSGRPGCFQALVSSACGRSIAVDLPLRVCRAEWFGKDR